MTTPQAQPHSAAQPRSALEYIRRYPRAENAVRTASGSNAFRAFFLMVPLDSQGLGLLWWGDRAEGRHDPQTGTITLSGLLGSEKLVFTGSPQQAYEVWEMLLIAEDLGVLRDLNPLGFQRGVSP